ncbi:hypothetical protein APA73_15690 [Pseudomonas aeruginosa]|uniref:fimbrial protein n=1 Tax=Pseudomonas aeruginosa TaxID=287 RepID=UPI00071B56A0|nr:fimbrial protein [Pseudomonas aeruginosa]KSL69710.1 hypothetical protein APA58_15280 [Pseudomonas aeruginosa]KSM82959.1 hypothetical protein APA73_15690 [Pseudomonas aeruginosa]MDI2561140.1 type 1 fimbrial protein [Pseudomonas aeruginosa]HBN9636408.1 type 1 fimbrial protein [Pseudomonas aeruginosa]HCF4140027.1 type 1 fimbrial protein [Pseudomonas aeruginosa]
MKNILLRRLFVVSEAHWPRLLFLALSVACVQARADGTWDDCVRSGGTGDIYQYFPATTIYLGRDAAVGDVVGPWITASSMPAWSCTRRTGYGGTAVQVLVQGYPPYTLLGTLSHDGGSYAYYRAGDASAALAYIARWRAVVNGVYTDWSPLIVAGGVYQNAASTVTVDKTAGETYTIGVETQIRFVKRTTALVAGYTQGILDPIYVRHYQQVGGSTSVGTGTYRISQMTPGTATFEGGGTCVTPDVSVSLGSTPAGDFSGIGTTVARTPFTLSFQNCPPNLASIAYSFTPTTSVVDAAQGVVALDATSTATGVGIQLLTQAGAAVQFGTAYPLESYDSSQAASYSVDLQAGYYQTATTVSAGSANTAITFTMNYK